MRVRYEMVGMDNYIAKCDLAEKQARALYEKLKSNLACMWAELVIEDEHEEEYKYMDIVESFNHTKQALLLYKLFGKRMKTSV